MSAFLRHSVLYKKIEQKSHNNHTSPTCPCKQSRTDMRCAFLQAPSSTMVLDLILAMQLNYEKPDGECTDRLCRDVTRLCKAVRGKADAWECPAQYSDLLINQMVKDEVTKTF
eukprot:g24960.t1